MKYGGMEAMEAFTFSDELRELEDAIDTVNSAAFFKQDDVKLALDKRGYLVADIERKSKDTEEA